MFKNDDLAKAFAVKVDRNPICGSYAGRLQRWLRSLAQLYVRVINISLNESFQRPVKSHTFDTR